MLIDLTSSLEGGQSLSADAISVAARVLLEPTEDEASIKAKAEFLRALARKGETPLELEGFVREFLAYAVKPPLDIASLGCPVVDVVGTGGDKLGLFNVSTTSMFVVAAAGVAVVKHGNRGITSPSGSADVLAALGGRIDLPPERFAEGVKRVGVAFMLAPQYHPAFKAIAPVRQRLAAEGQVTMFNRIGPLLNPLQPPFQIVGVYDRSFVAAYADILAGLDRERAWVVHGETGDGRGMDELSTLGENMIAEAVDRTVCEWTEDTSSFLPRPVSLAQLAGGDAKVNAEILESILRGETRGPKRDLVLLNAAAALVVTRQVETLPEGVALAAELIDSGRAAAKLQAWREFA